MTTEEVALTALNERNELATRIRTEAEKIADTSLIRQEFLYSDELSQIAIDAGVNPLNASEYALANSRSEILSEKFSDFFETQFGLSPEKLFSLETDLSTLEEGIDKAQSMAAKESLYFLASAKRRGLKGFDLRREFELSSISRYGDPEDVTDVVFTDILRNPELRRKWLNTLYEQQLEETKSNLLLIDEAAEKREVVKKDLVIVGGGPLTSVAVSILSPYYDITVITQEESVGEPWLHRPIYLNSPAEQTDLDAPRFPLQDNSTTSPISPAGFVNVPDLGTLVNDDALVKICDANGVVRNYPSGLDLGAAVATNIAFYTNDYLVNQRVITESTSVKEDGTVKFDIEDKSGIRRSLEANKVLFLTGPGEEKLKINSRLTKSTFERSGQEIEKIISLVKEAISEGKKIPNIADMVPPVLTLPRIQKLFRLWDVDLNADPKCYPFSGLLKKDKTVAFIGNKDTSLTTQELFSKGTKGPGNDVLFGGPPEFYPGELEDLQSPRKILIGQGNLTSRRRYESSVGKNTRIIDGRAYSFFSITGNDITIQVDKTDGGFDIVDADYVILATGLSKNDSQTDFPLLDIVKEKDRDNYTVGLTSKGGQPGKGSSVLIAGSATGFTKKDFPEPIINTIDTLGIGENTIALWVHATLEERLIWHDMAQSTGTINTEKYKRLISKNKKSSVK